MQLSDFSLLFPPSRNAIQTVKLGQLLFYQGILNEQNAGPNHSYILFTEDYVLQN